MKNCGASTIAMMLEIHPLFVISFERMGEILREMAINVANMFHLHDDTWTIRELKPSKRLYNRKLDSFYADIFCKQKGKLLIDRILKKVIPI